MTKPQQADFGLSQLLEFTQDELAKYRLIAGHMPFGIHEKLGIMMQYFGFLRDPIERSISDYYFVKTEPPSHYLYHQARTLSIEKYLAYRASISRDNVQTRLVSGLWDTVPFEPVNAGMLDLAKQNLQSHFILVGLAEKFDESLLVLQRILALPNVYYMRRNVTAARPRYEELSERDQNSLQYYNQLDLALYEHAQKLFAQQRANYGLSLDEDVRVLRRRNRLLGGPMHQYWRIRGFIRKTIENRRYAQGHLYHDAA